MNFITLSVCMGPSPRKIVIDNDEDDLKNFFSLQPHPEPKLESARGRDKVFVY